VLPPQVIPPAIGNFFAVTFRNILFQALSWCSGGQSFEAMMQTTNLWNGDDLPRVGWPD
jgi:hypothetical protein